MRRLEDKETTTTGAMTMVTRTCHRMWRNDHHYLEEEGRLTTTQETIGLRERTTTTTMTRMTAVNTSTQDTHEEKNQKRHYDVVRLCRLTTD